MHYLVNPVNPVQTAVALNALEFRQDQQDQQDFQILPTTDYRLPINRKPGSGSGSDAGSGLPITDHR